ncbi:MAG: hypothetical protein U5M53_07315 [Rhodoferax sp.]|nr:hypothetical protein [Rhodoferax sp.]
MADSVYSQLVDQLGPKGSPPIGSAAGAGNTATAVPAAAMVKPAEQPTMVFISEVFGALRLAALTGLATLVACANPAANPRRPVTTTGRGGFYFTQARSFCAARWRRVALPCHWARATGA